MIESQGDKIKAVVIAVLIVSGAIYWAFENGLFDFKKKEVVTESVVIPPLPQVPVSPSLFDQGSKLSNEEKQLIYKLGKLKSKNDELEAVIVEDKIASIKHAAELRKIELEERRAALIEIGKSSDALPMGMGVVRELSSSDSTKEVRLIGITNDGIALVSNNQSIHQMRPGEASGELSLVSLDAKEKLAVVNISGSSITLSMNSISSRSRAEITENYNPPSENTELVEDTELGIEDLGSTEF